MFNQVKAASRRLQGHAQHTPIMTSRTLDRRTGARVLLKCENFQRVGAFRHHNDGLEPRLAGRQRQRCAMISGRVSSDRRGVTRIGTRVQESTYSVAGTTKLERAGTLLVLAFENRLKTRSRRQDRAFWNSVMMEPTSDGFQRNG